MRTTGGTCGTANETLETGKRPVLREYYRSISFSLGQHANFIWSKPNNWFHYQSRMIESTYGGTASELTKIVVVAANGKTAWPIKAGTVTTQRSVVYWAAAKAVHLSYLCVHYGGWYPFASEASSTWRYNAKRNFFIHSFIQGYMDTMIYCFGFVWFM